MREFMRLAGCLLLLAPAASPTAARAETSWVQYYGNLAAVSLDFQSWKAVASMQVVDAPGVFLYALATEPGTGDLWATYRDEATGADRLGIWPAGAPRPVDVATIANAYQSDIEFAPTGELYIATFEYPLGSFVATVNLTTGATTPIVILPEADWTNGLAFNPTDGRLYFSGNEDCATGCVGFVDALTLPDHQRTRVWEASLPPNELSPYFPLFDDAGALAIAGYRGSTGLGYYRPTAEGVELLGRFATSPTPFGETELWYSVASPATGTAGCVPSPTRACLQHRRFQIEVAYDATILNGTAGTATPSVESDQTVKFSFFDPANLELFLKVIDGCAYNGHYWLFASGLTNAGVALRVTDKVTGELYSYDNPAGQNFVPRFDINALACD